MIRKPDWLAAISSFCIHFALLSKFILQISGNSLPDPIIRIDTDSAAL